VRGNPHAAFDVAGLAWHGRDAELKSLHETGPKYTFSKNRPRENPRRIG
jgi:hypothetical protein